MMNRSELSRETILNIYIPSGARDLHIAPASAIVGLENAELGNRIRAYFEGSIYGQRMSFEEKLQIASGRMVDQAPTVAFGFYDSADLILVGQAAYSAKLKGWIIKEAHDQAALEQWAGEAVTVGGSQQMRYRAAGIIFGELSPAIQEEIQERGAAGEDIVEIVLSLP